MNDEIRAIIFNLDGVILEKKVEMVYGAMDILDAARDRYSLAGITSLTRMDQHMVFDKFNLHYYFDAVITGDELKKTDPPGDPYVLAMQYLKDFPDQCVAVVDSVEHVYLARKAGCRVVALATNIDADALTEAGADKAVATFDELKLALGMEGIFIKT